MANAFVDVVRGVSGRRARLRTVVALAALAAATGGCGESSCPAGSTFLKGHCVDESGLQGDGGEGDAADAGRRRDAGGASTDAADGALDGMDGGDSDADAAGAACDAGGLGDGLSCVRDGCLPAAGEPAPCAANQQCTPLADGQPSCACSIGFADCDAEPANGCETETDTDPEHCGSCELACASGLACEARVCEPRVAHIALGVFASLFALPDGHLLGAGTADLIDDGQFSVPTVLQRGNVQRPSAYHDHACALRRDAEGATCWGNNARMQLGSTNTADTSFTITTAGNAICAGNNHSCFATESGEVYCWGNGYSGEYGDGLARDISFPPRGFGDAATAPVPHVSDALDVVCGREINCALTSEATVFCWGQDGGTAYASELVRDELTEPLTDVQAICAGNLHACALRGDGSVACWGNPADGRLGAGATVPSMRGRFVTAAVSGVAALACGSAHTCALLEDGGVRCWGSGANGALGAGDTAAQPVPISPNLPPGSVATAIYSGSGAAATCASLTTGQVYCWGYNYYGQLGLGRLSQSEVDPVEVTAWP
jgi:hypothetical protein